MNPKQDRPGARTPADLERKYNFGENFHEIKQSINQQNTAIEKQGHLFTNYVNSNDKALQTIVENYSKLLEKVSALEKSNSSQKEKIESLEQNNASIQGEITKYWEKVYPVGAIYMSVSANDPSALFGGTWERIKDRFLLSAGDTYGAGSTGGEANHTLTVDEMPSHNHNFWLRFTAGSDGSMYAYQALGNSGSSQAYSGATAGSGGNKSHNNMPPYIVVYVWKRTA